MNPGLLGVSTHGLLNTMRTVLQRRQIAKIFVACLLVSAIPSGASAKSDNPHLDDRIWSTALANDGTVALVGDFIGTANFGGKTLRSLGDYDGFVSMLNADGTHRWSRRVGSLANDRLFNSAFDSTGALYVAGVTRGQMTIGNTTYGNQQRCTWGRWCEDVNVIVKFSPRGEVDWVWESPGDFEWTSSIAIDNADYLWVAQGFWYRGEGVQFGARFMRFDPIGRLVSGGGRRAKRNGDLISTDQYTQGLYITDLKVDAQGDLVATGSITCIAKFIDSGLTITPRSRNSTLSANNENPASSQCYGSPFYSPSDAVVIKFAPDGELRWATNIGSASYDWPDGDTSDEWLDDVVTLPDGTILAGGGYLDRAYDFYRGIRQAKRTAIALSPNGNILGEFRAASVSTCNSRWSDCDQSGYATVLAGTLSSVISYSSVPGSRVARMQIAPLRDGSLASGSANAIGVRGPLSITALPDGRFVAVSLIRYPYGETYDVVGFDRIATLKRESGARHLVVTGRLTDTVVVGWKRRY